MQFEYYSILEIQQSATPEEIKKAYRKKAMELHPDRHGGDKQKEAEFKKLNEAYGILSDAQKRAHYDQYGTMENSQGGGGFGGFGGGFDAGDLGDIFSSFFGGSNGGRAKQKRGDIGEDIEIKIKISLEDAIRGTTRKIEYDQNTTCHHCSGRGGETKTCDTCKGHGQIRERVQTIFGVMEQARTCGVCGGTGQKIIDKCTHCNGKGKLRSKTEKTLEIPKGIDDGMTIKLRGEGHKGNDGNGDLYVTFAVPHEEGGLTRSDADLHYTHTISPAAAVLGIQTDINIPILGKKNIDISAGTQHGTTFVFRGEGMTKLDRSGGIGNLTIHININIPKKLSSDQKKLYEALIASEGGKMKKGWLEELFGE